MAWPEIHDEKYHDLLTKDQEQNPYSFQYGLKNDTTNHTRQMLAQTFQPGSTTLDKAITAVELYLQGFGSPTGYIWVEIFNTSSNVPSSYITFGADNRVARSGKIKATNISTASGGPYTFYLPKGIRLAQGTTYAIVLRCEYTESATNYIAWNYQRHTVDPYANGKIYQYNGSNWFYYDDVQYYYDFVFATYYGETNTPILDQLPAGAGQIPEANLNLGGLSGEGHILIPCWAYSAVKSGSTWGYGTTADNMLYQRIYNSSAANLDWIEYKVFLAAGTYTMKVLYEKHSDGGIVDIDFNGVEKASIDMRCDNPFDPNKVHTTENIVVGSPGLVTIRFRLDGTSGSYYWGYLCAIVLFRTA